MPSISDKLIIIQLKAGNKTAFKQAYDKYAGPLCAKPSPNRRRKTRQPVGSS